MLDINPGQIALQYFTLLFSLCVHEAAHAIAAYRCGDPTAKMLGRITLDPRKHVDPIGTVVMPLLAMVTNIPLLIGWAKPVPFILRNLRNPRRDPVLIALAGPASNLLVGILCLPILRILYMFGTTEIMGIIFTIFLYLTLINFALMLFNLLPVPPPSMVTTSSGISCPRADRKCSISLACSGSSSSSSSVAQS